MTKSVSRVLPEAEKDPGQNSQVFLSLVQVVTNLVHITELTVWFTYQSPRSDQLGASRLGPGQGLGDGGGGVGETWLASSSKCYLLRPLQGQSGDLCWDAQPHLTLFPFLHRNNCLNMSSTTLFKDLLPCKGIKKVKCAVLT